METGNYLGIYLSKDKATVVCLSSHSKSVVGCFSVSIEGQAEANLHTLANLITQGCTERGLQFSEAVVAMDCAMIIQHNVHSEFSDPKRIAATVRFDTEEALATDITELAITFRINSSSESSSELTVFTAQRKILSDVLGALQGNNIDPVAIEPDINSLSRFICQKVSVSEGLRPLFVMLSDRRGYLIIPPVPAGTEKGWTMRTFLIGPKQQRSELIAREVIVTTALIKDGGPISSLKVFDANGSVNCQQFSERLGIETSLVDVSGSAAVDEQTALGCDDLVGFAIAYGAALAHTEKAQRVSFRDDFMPYQGGKVRLQKTLKLVAVSVCVLLITVGLYFQSRLFKINRDRGELRGKFAKEYAAVMLGEKLPDKTDAVKKLMGELRHVRDGLSPVTRDESVSSKLTLVLEAFNNNNCATATNLEIESISISDKVINVAGSTSSRANTLKLFDTVSKSGLEIVQQRLSIKGARDDFSIQVTMRKQMRAGL